MADVRLAFPIGQRIRLPGHFDVPVTLEDARPVGSGYECRVRLGEWLWQVGELCDSEIVLMTCPAEKLLGFENELLERYCRAHTEYALANRDGPRGVSRWWPGWP